MHRICLAHRLILFFLRQPFCSLFMSNSRQSVELGTVQRKLLRGEIRVILSRWMLYFPLSIQECSSHLIVLWGCHQRDLKLTSSIWRDWGHESREQMISLTLSPLWTGSLMMGVFKTVLQMIPKGMTSEQI